MNATTNYKTAILEAKTTVAFWKEALADKNVTDTKIAFSYLSHYNKAKANLKEVEQTCAYFKGADYLATV